jgi:hypothetical protein
MNIYPMRYRYIPKYELCVLERNNRIFELEFEVCTLRDWLVIRHNNNLVNWTEKNV